MFVKIAHRGESKHEPENTLRSFRRALSLGASAIECDVHKCKSGELVVIHDSTLKRTTNGKGRVSKKTYKELIKLDDGLGEHIPLLHEVIELINKKAQLHIELKGSETGARVARMLSGYYGAGWKPTDFIVSSFSKKELNEFRKFDSITPIGYLPGIRSLGMFHFAKKIHAYSIHIARERASENLITKIHEKGFKVFVYTVDSFDEAKKLREWGADGVFSNCIDEI